MRTTSSFRRVETDLVRSVRSSADARLGQGALLYLRGEAGTGKTTAVTQVLASLDTPTAYVAPRLSRLSPRALCGALFESLGITQPLPRAIAASARILTQNLARRPCVIAYGDADMLTRPSHRLIGDIHHGTSSLALLTGLPHLKPLEAAADHSIEARPMERAEVLRLLPRLHPLWEQAPSALIADLDDYLHGNLRHWQHATAHYQRALERGSMLQDPAAMHWVLRRMGLPRPPLQEQPAPIEPPPAPRRSPRRPDGRLQRSSRPDSATHAHS
ncbi:hypothetical protein ADK76_23370 [Streptomyces griseoflavus]|uniref:AAA family ATPase n=1 Tax=Streptomyces rimosus TaxID=1927 RepID=UPI0004CAE293|nr:AAA family ATPase [Streptomyces rimosus]KOG54413.1 hypothetical protein ADK76_23370 [Streptomyces griseoflavus]